MSGGDEFAALSRRLKDAGEKGLARELRKALKDAAEPIAREIRDPVHLARYMPDRYAGVLASDVKVSTTQRGSIRNPGVRLEATGKAKKRKVIKVNKGLLTHPLFGDRDHWYTQTDGMKAGFFTDPCEKSGPQVRNQILTAMHDTAAKITRP